MAFDVTFILATITVLVQLLILGLLGLLIFKKSKKSNKILEFFRKNAVLLAFIAALLATGGSLFFSEIMHYEPCKLCWWQRIFMYPQVIILGMTLIKKKMEPKCYIRPLSVIGGLIAIYQYIEQVNLAINPAANATCGINAVSCASTPFFYYGYITIPIMALTVFIFNIIMMSIKKDAQ